LKIAGSIDPAIFMRILLVALALYWPTPALAVEPALAPFGALAFQAAGMLQTGSCVVYEEGGSGWVMTDPCLFTSRACSWRRSANPPPRQVCPQVPGQEYRAIQSRGIQPQAKAFPVFRENTPERDEQIGIVRLRSRSWETPHAKRRQCRSPLSRHVYRPQLEKDMEIELEADLLGVCAE
jgi:hypothetical protein